MPSTISVAWLLESEDAPEVFGEVPEEATGGAVPVPPSELGLEPVCDGAANEVMAGVESGEAGLKDGTIEDVVGSYMNKDADAGEEEPYPDTTRMTMSGHGHDRAVRETHQSRKIHNHPLAPQSGLSSLLAVRVPQHYSKPWGSDLCPGSSHRCTSSEAAHHHLRG